MGSKSENPIYFTGPPSKLRAQVDIARVDFRRAKLKQNATLKQYKAMPVLSYDGDAKTISTLALSLPDDTPAGKITTYVEAEKRRYKTVIDVLTKAVIRVKPSLINIDPSNIKPETINLTVSNLGNVDQAYDHDTVITLRRSDAFAKSITKTFKNSGNVALSDRLINLGKSLESSDSEQLEIDCKTPSKTLKKGQSKTVKLVIQPPNGLAPDSSWTGSFGMLGKRVRINVVAQTSRTAPNRSSTRRRKYENTE